MVIKVTFLFCTFEVGGLVGRIEFRSNISYIQKFKGSIIKIYLYIYKNRLSISAINIPIYCEDLSISI